MSLPTRSVSLVAAGLLLLTACGQSNNNQSADNKVILPAIKEFAKSGSPVLPAGDGKAQCSSDVTLGFIGILNGPNAAIGKVQLEGAKLALKQHNDHNPNCQVQMRVLDSEGSPEKAPGVVAEIINDPKIIGVIGPSFSGESQAVGALLNSAGLVNITGFATLPGLTQNGWNTFFRAVGNDSVSATSAADLLKNKLKAKRTFVVSDDGVYGTVLGNMVKEALGADAFAGADRIINGTTKDYSTIVAKINKAKADAVYYAGYYTEAAAFFTQLGQGGYKGYLVGPDAIKDDELMKLSGQYAENAYMTCPCVDGSLIEPFASDFKREYGRAPGTFSADLYDIATIFLAGIDKGKTTRADLLEWVRSYDAPGIAKHYKFAADGDLEKPAFYYYRVDKGKIVPVGNYDG